jgi:hypothetical protein
MCCAVSHAADIADQQQHRHAVRRDEQAGAFHVQSRLLAAEGSDRGDTDRFRFTSHRHERERIVRSQNRQDLA